MGDKVIKLDDLEQTNLDIIEYKSKGLDKLSHLDWFKFAKANESYGEPGVSYEELWAIFEALETFNGNAITILETGQCFGTTTRFFAVYVHKHGGELHSMELNIREPFKKDMQDMGLWEHVIQTHEGNSMKLPWNKTINFLFIDSEHHMEDALGEYMRYRIWLQQGSIVGFHDSQCCPGVRRAIDVAKELDDLELVSCVDISASAGVELYKWKGRN